MFGISNEDYTSKELNIACDVDDVLAAFYPTLCKRVGNPETQVNIWDGIRDCSWVADMFPKLYENEAFYGTLNLLSNPNSINFDIACYITSIPESLHEVRSNWLAVNGFPERPVICTLDSKVEAMKEYGINVLIDDKPSTVRAVRKNSMYGIQFVPSYMKEYDKKDPFSIRHLSEVPSILEKIKKGEL